MTLDVEVYFTREFTEDQVGFVLRESVRVRNADVVYRIQMFVCIKIEKLLRAKRGSTTHCTAFAARDAQSRLFVGADKTCTAANRF